MVNWAQNSHYQQGSNAGYMSNSQHARLKMQSLVDGESSREDYLVRGRFLFGKKKSRI